MELYGIDVSHFQGNIDWEKVKKDGIQFAMLQAGYGAGNIDVQFRRNAEGCTKENIPFGVYWLSYAYTPQMAREEAEYCIETVEEYRLSYPVCFVFEEAAIRYARTKGVFVTKTLATELAEAFCGRVEELGYSAMYYSNQDFLENVFDERLHGKYKLWYAQHTGLPHINDMSIWRYTNEGSVKGIDGPVGENVACFPAQ